MNSQTIFRGKVTDASTGSPISSAKVGVTNQGVGEVSKANGTFYYRKYHETLSDSDKLIVSAPGYETIELGAPEIRLLFNKNSTIKLEKASQKVESSNLKNLKIFWDMSEGLQGRNLEEEIATVSKFLDSKKIAVELVVFNNEIVTTKRWKTWDGDINGLRKSVMANTYDGPSNYNVLDFKNADAVILVSDGAPNYGKLGVSQDIPVYVVSSTPPKDGAKYLQKLADYTSGEILVFDGASSTNPNTVGTLETKETPYSSSSMTEGKVVSLGKPIQGATLSLKGSMKEYTTKADGSFRIPESEGNILVVRALGLFTKEVLIERQNLGTIDLIPKNNDLDAVVIGGQQRIDNTVQTANGAVDKETIGYAIDTIDEDDFSDGYTSLRQLIEGKLSGVDVRGGLYSGSVVVYRIRGGNNSINNQRPPIWIVNGTPYEDEPNFLDVQQIKSITVLKSAMATSRYGTIATGGAFIIKTKQLDFEEIAKAEKKSALVTGNEYLEDSRGTVRTTEPAYIKSFREAGSPEKQMALYKRLSRTQESPLEFYVDAAQYFQGLSPTLGSEVRSDFAYIARNSTKALRTLAYLYEEIEDTGNVVLINERIVKIAPQEAQSYRDLALAYQNNRQYDKALELYINMLGEQIKGINFDGLEKPLGNELSRLISLHKDQIDFDRLPNEWLRSDYKIDMRMVIEWSDKSVPFEFQFVNPDKKYFTWEHTLASNGDRLKAEQEQGFQTEEFIIDDAQSGEWIINVQYLGGEGDYVLPPFLKYTFFRNYGTSKETKEVRVIKLFKQVDKVTLGRVTI